MFCKNCGAQNNEKSIFCEVCGSRLKKAPLPPKEKKKSSFKIQSLYNERLVKIIAVIVVLVIVIIGTKNLIGKFGNHKEIGMDVPTTTIAQTTQQPTTEAPKVIDYTGWSKDDAVKDLQSQGYRVAIDTKEYHSGIEKIGTIVFQDIDVNQKTATLGINKGGFESDVIKKSKATIKVNTKKVTLKVGEKKTIFCKLSGTLPKDYKYVIRTSGYCKTEEDNEWVDYNWKNAAITITGKTASKGYLRIYLSDTTDNALDTKIAYCDIYVNVEEANSEIQQVNDYTGWSKKKAVEDLEEKGWKVIIDKFKYNSCKEKIGTVVYQDVNTDKKTVTLGISQDGFNDKIKKSKAVIKVNVKNLKLKVGETKTIFCQISDNYVINYREYPEVEGEWGDWLDYEHRTVPIKITGEDVSRGYIRFCLKNKKEKKFAYYDVYVTVEEANSGSETQNVTDYTGWSKQKAVKELESKGWKVVIDKFKYKSCREKLGTVVYQDVNADKKTVTLGISQSGFSEKIVKSKAVIKADKKTLKLKVGETKTVLVSLSGSLPREYKISCYYYPDLDTKWVGWRNNYTKDSIKLTGKSASKGYVRFYLINQNTKKFIAYYDVYVTVKK